jgi:replication factor C small subunit
MKSLWVEKWRPKTVDGYVFRDEAQRSQVLKWIEDKSIPHLLFSGNAGIGKTTLAKLLLNELEVDPLDILEINASRTNSVDDVRNKIVSFIQMIPFGDFKVVLLDEADYLSPNAQAALRGVMEEYHTTSRFILTCNYPNKIIPALHSRCQGFHIAKIDQTEFTARVAQILIEEGVEFELDTLDTYVKATYPDLRKCINMVQMNSTNGQLISPNEGDSGQSDWKLEMVSLFKSGRINDARKLVCGKVRPEEIEEIYKWLYENLEIFGSDQKQEDAILIIKQGLVDHTLVVDPEINLAATLIQLSRL